MSDRLTDRVSTSKIVVRLAAIPDLVLLAAVAVLAAIAQIVLVGDMPYNWDETIYISQNANGIPPAFLSAPRSRGTSWLVWPIAHFTVDNFAVSTYLAIVAALLLVAAFYPWTRILKPRVAPLAAFIFAFTWSAIIFGSSAFPNYWLAVACVSATGWFILAANRPAKLPIILAGVSVLIAAIFRWSDTIWLVAALLFCAIVVPAWRRRFWLMASLCVGFAIGFVPWVVEAYMLHGGPIARLARASQIQGGTSPQFNVITALRSAEGPMVLCRPCRAPVPVSAGIFWLIGAALVVLALAVAWRLHERRSIFVPAVAAAAIAIPYLFLIYYSAGRFLLPTYALAALPVAYALFWLCRPSRFRVIAIVGVVLALGLNLVYQVRAAEASKAASVKSNLTFFPQIAADITAHGVTPPCIIAGAAGPPIGFYTRCRSISASGANKNVSTAELEQLVHQYPTAVPRKPGAKPPLYAQGWSNFVVTNGKTSWAVYYNIPAAP